MGKKQHSKDKLYILPSEYCLDWGGYKFNNKPVEYTKFDECALTLMPIKDAVCTKEGIVYEKDNIERYIDIYGQNPFNGEQLSKNDVIQLHYNLNSEGKFCCPITKKAFGNSSHIVVNSKSGYVYSYNTVDELNRKARNWNDLVTGEKFSSKDLIVIQDPLHFQSRELKNFHYIKEGRRLTAQFGDLRVSQQEHEF
ncbi:uncharacterized protein CMU_008110 [Cryptosporidium muris RN66]|uniref:U-box domain-containing protein n=1 Tax=Cryptosporidium muris (strain RN66) TaxID=441375 RepID=B6ADM9_CRYMR|nr:uncharacterized protein CMU_008110 [Cryptosporidium muris RN66]EEA06320.1 hypothetical protein, conserved [Cryptosporidium muris RN66]|eukprot:XP_002140669.1 hypothetical protein [Cryptosporidium muris RN66]